MHIRPGERQRSRPHRAGWPNGRVPYARRQNARSPRGGGPVAPGVADATGHRMPSLWTGTSRLFLMLLTGLVTAAPAAAQPVADDLPPARIAKGPPLSESLVTGLRRHVRDAVASTAQHAQATKVGTSPGAPSGSRERGGRMGRWGRVTCELRDVSIELESGDFPRSSVAAVVVGRALTYVDGGYPTKRAALQGRGAADQRTADRGRHVATVAFALLYVLPAEERERGGGAWRLALAQYRPERNASSGAAGAGSGRDELAWQDLWSSGGSAAAQTHCPVAAMWRRLGER